LPKGDQYLPFKNTVCNYEKPKIVLTPVEKEPVSGTPKVTRRFHPIYFVLGLLLSIGGIVFIYQKIAVITLFSLFRHTTDSRK
jgi:hypothetical protein